MKLIIKIIGCMVVSAFLYAIPMVLAASLCFNWDGFWKLLYLTIGFAEYIALAALVYYYTENGEEK